MTVISKRRAGVKRAAGIVKASNVEDKVYPRLASGRKRQCPFEQSDRDRDDFLQRRNTPQGIRSWRRA